MRYFKDGLCRNVSLLLVLLGLFCGILSGVSECSAESAAVAENLENAANVASAEIVENVKNIKNVENAKNVEDANDTGNAGNAGNIEEAENVENVENTAEAALEMDEAQQTARQEVGIVLLGNPRYLQPEYLDILNRYFVKCYSQYRYPTEFGISMQEKLLDGYRAVYAGSRESNGRTAFKELDFPALTAAMGKEQVLFLKVDDLVFSSWRRLGWDWGSEIYWEAVVEAEAVLADRKGVIRREKVMRRVDEKYTPSSALHEAYTYCVRSLQQKKLFQ